MLRSRRLVYLSMMVALVVAGCTDTPEPPTSPSSTPTEEPSPEVAPILTTSGFVEQTDPGAWLYPEYAAGLVKPFEIPGDDELCALRGDYAVTSSAVQRVVRGWYLPDQTLAWEREEAVCPGAGFGPQHIPSGVVVGIPAAAEKPAPGVAEPPALGVANAARLTDVEMSAALVDFASGEALLELPVVDRTSQTAPMPLGITGDTLVLEQDGSPYGVNRSGTLMWELDAPGWSWSKNMMTGHVFGVADQGKDVMVVNGVTGQVTVETSVPSDRPITFASNGFMLQKKPDEPFTFVALDGVVSELDPAFEGGRYVPTARAGALFPLNLYLNPDAGPVFDARGNPVEVTLNLEHFHAAENAEPEIVAVTADGGHVLVDDRAGHIYLTDAGGNIVWQRAALRPWVLGSYIVIEGEPGAVRILIPDFAAAEQTDAD